MAGHNQQPISLQANNMATLFILGRRVPAKITSINTPKDEHKLTSAASLSAKSKHRACALLVQMLAHTRHS
jgi:hypothetical protein